MVVVGHDAAAHLELEFAVRACEFRRALPLDLQVEIAAAGTGCSGLRLLHLALEGGHLGLHGPHLRLELCHVCGFGGRAAGSQNPDNARAREQIAVHPA